MTLAKAVGKSGYFMTYILNRIAANKNFICAITGPTGGGKS
jgi:Tfp pilus assembly pilus retraction ATPase PilT